VKADESVPISEGERDFSGTPKPGATWKEVPRGGVVMWGGNARTYETGDWRSMRPIYDSEVCIQCRLCWIYCPDSAIEVNDEGEVIGVNLFHCKGCGICAFECPVDALKMVPEDQSDHA
jgi:pyruvate ferredoxin oxidoreductase delta subunit